MSQLDEQTRPGTLLLACIAGFILLGIPLGILAIMVFLQP